MDQLEIIQEEENVVVDNLFVPDVNSNDPEERKLARRIRIQKRIEAVERQHKGIEQLRRERAAERVTLLQTQLEKSSEVLHELFKEAEHQVTNVRVANDKREVDRREGRIVRRGEIHDQLAEDARLSMEMFEEIAAKWNEVMEYNDPLRIYEDLLLQKEKCDEMIKQKDTVIGMLRHELYRAETRFFLDQQAQNTDIRLLAKRVENQVTIMRAAHAVELQHIEDVMIQERANMMENNDKRWNEMYKRRKEQELAISAFKVKQQQDFEETVTKVRVSHYEKIREVKIALERDCGRLQKEFECVKMSALINSEKMDYNYQILKKREDENIIIKGNQKRLYNKLQDNINKLKIKMKEYDTKAKAKVKKLYSEILTMQRCINNEKRKSKNISYTNDDRYMQIWELNRKAANKILKRIMGIDKILCEQQLGMNWHEPRIKLQVKEKLPSYKNAVKVLSARPGTRIGQRSLRRKRKKSIPLEKLGEPDHSIGAIRLMYMVMENLAKNGGFLIEAGVDNIITNTTKNQEILVKVDSVLDTLGINLARDVNVMMHFFRPYIYCPLCTPEGVYIEETHEVDVSNSSASLTQLLADGSGGNGAQAIDGAIGDNAFDIDLTHSEADKVIDTIIASVITDKKASSSSQLNIVEKEGECIGPSKMMADAEKRMAQMGDQVTVLKHNASESCLINHPLYMNPSMVMRALREFVTKAKCKIEAKHIVSSDADLTKTTQTISRMLCHKEVKDYWDRYRVILAARTTDLWHALEYALKKYHRILEERQKLDLEVKTLRKQNQELRYLSKRFDIGLVKKPPCASERRSYEVMNSGDFHPDMEEMTPKK